MYNKYNMNVVYQNGTYAEVHVINRYKQILIKLNEEILTMSPFNRYEQTILNNYSPMSKIEMYICTNIHAFNESISNLRDTIDKIHTYRSMFFLQDYIKEFHLIEKIARYL